MTETLLKHSRTPRKAGQIAPVKKKYTVAKRPLANLTEEQRSTIAREVLDGYMRGAQVADMAPKYGVSDVTVYALLLREHEQEWVDTQRARALARYERSMTDVQEAPDALSLARAREVLRSAQWELERLLRRLYGQDQVINVNVFDLGDRLRRARDRVIDVSTQQIEHISGDCQVVDENDKSDRSASA